LLNAETQGTVQSGVKNASISAKQLIQARLSTNFLRLAYSTQTETLGF